MDNSYEDLLQFVYQSPVGLVQATMAGEIAMMTPKAVQLLMPLAGRAEIVNIYDALASAAPELRHLAQTFDKKRGAIVERRRCPLLNAGGQLSATLEIGVLKMSKDRIIVQIQDITELVMHENKAMLHAHMMEAIVDNICDQTVCVIDRKGQIVSWNSSGARLHGFSSDEVVGKPFGLIATTPHEDAASAAEDWASFLDRITDRGAVRIQGLHQRKTGASFWAESVITPLQDSPVTQAGFVVVSRDITAERDRTIELEERASTDPLTGALNRRAFFDAAMRRLAAAGSSEQGYCVALLDIDHFKNLNDTYGHATGDRALVELVRACRPCVRDTDLICRFGGEEFLVFMPGADMRAATEAAERLRSAVSGIELHHDAGLVTMTVSIGLAAARPGEVLQSAIERADTALYAAKDGGRDRIETADLAA